MAQRETIQQETIQQETTRQEAPQHDGEAPWANLRLAIDGMHCANCAANIEKHYRATPAFVDVAGEPGQQHGARGVRPGPGQRGRPCSPSSTICPSRPRSFPRTPRPGGREAPRPRGRPGPSADLQGVRRGGRAHGDHRGHRHDSRLAHGGGRGPGGAVVPEPPMCRPCSRRTSCCWRSRPRCQFGCGARFYKGAWGSLKGGSANMDVLVALGTSSRFCSRCGSRFCR